MRALLLTGLSALTLSIALTACKPAQNTANVTIKETMADTKAMDVNAKLDE